MERWNRQKHNGRELSHGPCVTKSVTGFGRLNFQLYYKVPSRLLWTDPSTSLLPFLKRRDLYGLYISFLTLLLQFPVEELSQVTQQNTPSILYKTLYRLFPSPVRSMSSVVHAFILPYLLQWTLPFTVLYPHGPCLSLTPFRQSTYLSSTGPLHQPRLNTLQNTNSYQI